MRSFVYYQANYFQSSNWEFRQTDRQLHEKVYCKHKNKLAALKKKGQTLWRCDKCVSDNVTRLIAMYGSDADPKIISCPVITGNL